MMTSCAVRTALLDDEGNLITDSDEYNRSHQNNICDELEQMAIDRTGELTVFVRAVEAGGFSAAAPSLELTPSAISKIVTRLEDRLGVRLLNRTTRSLSLTAEGEAFFARAQRILAEIDEAEREVGLARHVPQGVLRMQVSVALGLHHLPPVLPEFFARYPQIELSLAVTDRMVDIVEQGFDLAVRVGELIDSALVARKICDLHRVICAAPSYLAARGTPRKPEDLLQHNCLRLYEQPELSHWPFDEASAPGGVRRIQVRGNFSANNAETMLRMATAGLGIIRLMDLTVGPRLQRGDLVALLTELHHVEPVSLHALMPSGKHRLLKVAAMVDFLIEKFADAPWRGPLANE